MAEKKEDGNPDHKKYRNIPVFNSSSNIEAWKFCSFSNVTGATCYRQTQTKKTLFSHACHTNGTQKKKKSTF